MRRTMSWVPPVSGDCRITIVKSSRMHGASSHSVPALR